MNTIVNPSGPKDAKIAFVGEAPGADEVRTGIPFSGISGKKLNELMAAVGIVRSQVYVTNVIKEHPPKNNIKPFIDLSKKYPVMSPSYLKYERQLAEELSTCKANVIVAVGGVALWALCRLKKIESRRGSILESTLIPGRKVIPIIHPSAALRYGNFIKFRYINIDMYRIREESESPDLYIDDCQYDIITDSQYALNKLRTLNENLTSGYIKRASFDIECDRHSHALTAFGFGYVLDGKRYAFSIGLRDNQGNTFKLQEEIELMLLLEKALTHTGETPRYVMQNGMFDATLMFNKYGIRIAKWYDTMIGSRLVNPDYPAGLDFISSVYTRMPYFKDEGKDSDAKRIDESYGLKGHVILKNGIPITDFNLSNWDRWLLYNAKDCSATDIAIDPIIEDINQLGNEHVFESYIKLCHTVLYMGERGIKLAMENLTTIKNETQEKINLLEKEFIKLSSEKTEEITGVPIEININSNQQLMNYFYTTLKNKPYISPKTKNPTIDAKAVIRLSRKGIPGAKELSEYRKLSKLQSTYLTVKDRNGRLHGSYDPIGTKQGRLSSRKTIFDEGGNLQNQPLEMKKLMIADEGMILFDGDLSQAENRIVAYCGNEERMIEAFESNVDIHSTTASYIWPELSVEEIIYNNKMYEKTGDVKYCAPIADYSKPHRFWGKKSNHELNYGMGYKSFALVCEIPEKDAKLIVNKYHKVYPGVRRYQVYVENSLRRNSTVINPFNRSIHYMEKVDYNLFKRAYSYIPQSTVAWIMNEYGLNYCYYYLSDVVDVLMQTHDSITFQIPISIGIDNIVSTIMTIKQSIEVPIQWHQNTFIIPFELKATTTSLFEAKGIPSSEEGIRQAVEKLIS